ncbi:MAG: transposase [Bacteroidetes bacterium]|nr:transposase [Bacteroidota bacterium]MBL7915580.1 transposase [Bacteroidia bacterium]
MSEGKKAKVHRTKEEKLRIINEVQKSGLSVTCTKYGIYPASYYQWVAKLKEMGESGLQHGMTKEHLKEIRRLQKENDALRNLVADQQLESRMKDELLKKKYALPKGKRSH